MNLIKTNLTRLCFLCMEEHEVDIVEVEEVGAYKDKEIAFIVTYEYCPRADEYLETEDFIRTNRKKLIESYNRKFKYS